MTKSSATSHPATTKDTLIQRVFACLFGALLGLSLLKFGNPVSMDDQLGMPAGIFEWVLTAWPIALGQGLLVLVGLLGILAADKRPYVPRWVLFAPLPWLIWQFIALTYSEDRSLTSPILFHFCTNVGCYYLGLFCLSGVTNLKGFWAGLLAGFVLVLLSGWQQHFGGLEASRHYFFTEVYPGLEGDIPDALLRKMSSERIFATLFYPNTLAGAILLLGPVSLGAFTEVFGYGRTQRIGSMLTLALAGGCLFWSGSKAGWLLMLGLGMVVLFKLRFSRRLKVGVAAVVLAGGLVGFYWKYSEYLQKGAQSAIARLDYWQAALQITVDHPFTGTGPGTFGKSYAAIKRPESEMAQLTHNDYLQQACDSGLPGFLLFFGFMALPVVYLGHRVWNSPKALLFWVWLGLLGIILQCFVEFGWYIPAISWPMMALMGWLLGSTTNRLDNQKQQNLTSVPI